MLHRLKLSHVLLMVGAAVVAPLPSAYCQTFIGPVKPYKSFNDSPFKGVQFSYFHLETFEGGSLTAPGVTANANAVAIGPGFLTDSVDGGGNNGWSFFNSLGSEGIKFNFSAGILGHLPTSAGMVWTDGEGSRTFEAFDALGNSLGTIVDSTPHGYSSGDGDPNNYRFFGIVDSAGISAIKMSNTSGGIEVDHLQYGYQSSVPEGSSFVLFASGGLSAFALGVRRLRRKK